MLISAVRIIWKCFCEEDCTKYKALGLNQEGINVTSAVPHLSTAAPV